MAEPREELDEEPPETNLELQDCSEEQWRLYREEQAARLMQAAAESQATPSSSVQGGVSTMQAVDTVTTASAASTLMSGTLRTQRSTTTTVQSERDHQDLQKMFNFHKHDQSWKVPIIEFKDRILDIVGGEKINLKTLTS